MVFLSFFSSQKSGVHIIHGTKLRCALYADTQKNYRNLSHGQVCTCSASNMLEHMTRMIDNFSALQNYRCSGFSSVFISFISSKMSTPCKNYTAREKLKIDTFAENEGNWKAVRHFSIGESNIRLWHQQKPTLKLMPKNNRVDREKCARYPELEEKSSNGSEKDDKKE